MDHVTSPPAGGGAPRSSPHRHSLKAELRFHAWVIAHQTDRLIDFADRYGERAVDLLRSAIHLQFAEPPRHADPAVRDALQIVRDVSAESANLLPVFLNARAGITTIDRHA